ncbi:PPC domain-containing protein [Pendulispora rubella]|uniref:PPC domain-containing protein n=1 Tax=Pendulispora rubella TaxID=2741070 RepID=UPI00374E0705
MRFEREPKLGRYDCRPYLPGNNETCAIPNAKAGTYYVMVRGAANYAGVRLAGSFEKGGVR